MRSKSKDTPYCGVNQKAIKTAKPRLNTDNLRHLYTFITLRYSIHIQKDVKHLPPPWTVDPILSQYRFTNVRREHDRETKWLIDHITNNPRLKYEDKLLNCILFRIYNKHETAELLEMPIKFSKYQTDKGSKWDPEDYRKFFEWALKRNPKRIFFTGAFITGGTKRALKWYLPDKAKKNDTSEMRVLWFMSHLIKSNLVEKIKSCTTQQEAFKVLSSLMGIGEFLGYQIFVDMTYIRKFPFSENEFVVAGPGCKSGLNYIFKDRDGMTYEECLFWLRDNLNKVFQSCLGKKINFNQLMSDLDPEDRYMNVMSLENCICELSKYIRAFEGTGRPRQIYKAKESNR